MTSIIPPPASPSLPIIGSDLRFPIRRVFCIGRNYAEHAREMGASVDKSAPMFFCKPADAVVSDGADVPYPPATTDLHHEVEMVVALGAWAVETIEAKSRLREDRFSTIRRPIADAMGQGSAEIWTAQTALQPGRLLPPTLPGNGGSDLTPEQAGALVWGYGVGLDLTRRDLQAQAKAKGHPWDVAKAFDHSAPVSALRPASEQVPDADTVLRLSVNGQLRQQTRLGEMVHSVPEIIAALSRLFALKPGDLIFTGTPAGVAALQRGDRFDAELEGVARLQGKIV
ncbi:MAG TPA: fumarylacetoacetate hydrolase family protein [Gallionella sp.]|nr:fumarylacetoacetate hydrolase family protein [Gallionella sp.]